jgi:hypothetical protein
MHTAIVITTRADEANNPSLGLYCYKEYITGYTFICVELHHKKYFKDHGLAEIGAYAGDSS